MYTATVEVFSDQSNAAVMRHPGRKYPGLLVQGDTLHSLCAAAESCCKQLHDSLNEDASARMVELRDHLRSLVNHYKAVLGEHKIPLPFSDIPSV
jgi:hypothetical protein